MPVKKKGVAGSKHSQVPSAQPLLAWKFETALGSMALAWQGEALLAVQLPENEEHSSALLKALERRLARQDLRWSQDAPPFVRKIAEKIRLHLQGEPQSFPLDRLPWESLPPFFRKVYRAAGAIPSGQLRTYGALAAAAGSPRASRAVGQAMARNPFPLLVPCHRVVGSAGALTGFSAGGGISTKSKLIALESGSHAGSRSKSTSHH